MVNCLIITVFVVVAPNVHELVGRQFGQLTALGIAELAHKIAATIQVDSDIVLQLLLLGCRVILIAGTHLLFSCSHCQ